MGRCVLRTRRRAQASRTGTGATGGQLPDARQPDDVGAHYRGPARSGWADLGHCRHLAAYPQARPDRSDGNRNGAGGRGGIVNITFKTEGFRELAEELDEFPKSARNTVLGNSARRALQPIADRMAELAPYDPDDRDENGIHLKDTMRVQRARAKLARAMGVPSKNGVVVLAGPAPKGRRLRTIALSLEDGTGERFHKTGRPVCTVTAQPYARPATNSLSGEVIDVVNNEMMVQILKAAEGIVRNAARDAAKAARGG